MTYVYMHEFPNGKVYIGITDEKEGDWLECAKYSGNRAMFADILAYGWNNVKHKTVTECETRDKAAEMAQRYIDLYESCKPEKGYNRPFVQDEDYEARVAARNRTYEGFGVRHGASEWARIAGINRTVFWKYLRDGKTVEEVFRLRGIKYEERAKIKKPRKPKQSKEMKNTQELVYLLLAESGYVSDDGIDAVEVRSGTNQTHIITFEGQPFGVYRYKTGGLRLSGGDGIPLRLPGLDTPRVRRNRFGGWETHPGTRAEIFRLTRKIE